ncbi:MAG TPA: N-acetylmuramoyl-L-alanine amidase, partial [Roseiflexaceae bacterium]
MRRVLLLIVLVTFGGAVGAAHAPKLAAQSSTPRIGALHFSTVVDWQSGTRDSLLISNNDDGELRLAANRDQGVFTSSPIKTDFSFNAVGAVWRAEVTQGTSLKLEVRGGPTDDQLGGWRTLTAGDARSQSDDGALALESVLPFPADSAVLQFRATLNTTVANASPLLSEMTIKYISSGVG